MYHIYLVLGRLFADQNKVKISIGEKMIDKEYLKQYLIDNPNEIQTILAHFYFHDFHINNNQLRCALPDRENNTSVAVNMETLYSNIFVSPEYKGDFFGMLLHFNRHFGRNLKWKFGKLIRVIDEYILHLSETPKLQSYSRTEEKSEIIKGEKNRKEEVTQKENLEYDLNYLNKFNKLPHINFTNEGILPFIHKKYSICYDEYHRRIVIPQFKYDDKTKIVGLKARTTVEHAEIFDIPKYINYITGYEKSKNLYALSHNIDSIREHKQIILFEGEKSVLKLESFKVFPCVSVALGGSSLSDWQAAYIGELAKEIEDFEVVIAMDKDVPKEVVVCMGNKLKGVGCNLVNYIIDTDGLLEEKDSPIDKGIYVWFKLCGGRKYIF